MGVSSDQVVGPPFGQIQQSTLNNYGDPASCRRAVKHAQGSLGMSGYVLSWLAVGRSSPRQEERRSPARHALIKEIGKTFAAQLEAAFMARATADATCWRREPWHHQRPLRVASAPAAYTPPKITSRHWQGLCCSQMLGSADANHASRVRLYPKQAKQGRARADSEASCDNKNHDGLWYPVAHFKEAPS